MALKATSNILKKKYLIIFICIIGISAVSYGMLKDNRIIFIIGLVFVIWGYVLIRKKIKNPSEITHNIAPKKPGKAI